MKYLAELIDMIDQPNRDHCKKIIFENMNLFSLAPGSSHNHQSWPGGYLDHIQETMGIAVVLYEKMQSIRSLPFSLSDTLLVLFLHDLEKPWKHVEKFPFESKEEMHQFRIKTCERHGIKISPEINHAIKYTEGEIGDNYSSSERVMSPLAAFAHICDISSSRIWFDYPERN